MSQPAAMLHQYLSQLAARGVTHVPLTNEAQALLRRAPAPPGPGPAAPERAPPRAPAAQTIERQVAIAATPEKAGRLAQVTAEAAASPGCRALGTLRDVMVFATGSPDAELMFIGEAPGAEEERRGEPFVGPAGELLTKIIQAMGLTRSKVYISNICKYRPIVDDGRPQGNRNRPPTKVEMDTCLPFLTAEIEIIQPRIIVALGATATSGLGIEGSVGRLRGTFHDFRGIPVMATYHPSYLLRCEQGADGGNKEKRQVWEDLLQVMERLGLPISAKQRAYFTKPRS